MTCLIVFAIVGIGYYLTLAPEVTLEDSGELATGSFYAGIPHPPGYPVWTLYTWLWTVLVPFRNVAWRVALGEAMGGAAAAGLLGLLASRGSSLLIEGIDELKGLAGKWETAICMVCGVTAGLLIGFNGFMWSQSVIVEVYSFSVLSLMIVLLFLLRWIYAPHQRRWLYYALFFHGLCFTNHQTLIVAAMGIEVAIAAADFRMGRTLFLGNSILYLGGLILKQQHVLTALDQNQAVFVIFNVIGVASIAAYCWFAVLTKESFPEFCLDGSMAAFFVLLSAVPGYGFFFLLLALGAGAAWWKFGRETWHLGHEWLPVMICGLCWIVGAAFYFYMPLAGMTNPPMEWGYPRTVEGFIHAFTRGQYEKTNPTNIIMHPGTFLTQLMMMGRGIVDEFNWVYAFLALVPFAFFRKLHRRERAWLIGLTAIYLCLGVLLLILLNPPPDKAAQELVKVFFTASHTVIALMVGYGLALIAAYMATHYERFRSWGLLGGGAAILLAVYAFVEMNTSIYFGQEAKIRLGRLFTLVWHTFTNKDQYGLPVYAGLILIGLTLVFVGSIWYNRRRAPLGIALVLFAIMPVHSIMTHWADNEQRNHWFGYWFGHDMFTPPFKDAKGKPLYPTMAKDAVLYGGTDPGRFCPTYMIFCDSFVPSKDLPAFDQHFDRRDVYLITQNALADGTYLDYIRAQYNRSTQIDPPFFQELFRSPQERQDNYTTNFLARAVEPLDRFFTDLGARVERHRRTYTSWFKDSDFINLPALESRLLQRHDPLSAYLYANLSPATQELLNAGSGHDQALRPSLARDLNLLLERELKIKQQIAAQQAQQSKLEDAIAGGDTSSSEEARLHAVQKKIGGLSRIGPLYTPARFKGVAISEYLQDFINQNPQSDTRIRLNRLLLEAAYPGLIAKSKGGVYPDREIYIATPEDSSQCFQEYLADAQHRLQLHELKPGENVQIVNDNGQNKVQVSGQVAVMAINGLLTKVMFDHNPKNKFYVEESFPLDWMYPHLTPYGIIMKINRNPVPEITEDMIQRDHEFWSKYSARLIGNWITYDTSVKDIVNFCEKVYLHRDFSGFKGDPKFVRDDDAQKSFSKLRSSIGGIYNWRIGASPPGSAEQQRMVKEADFAFRQAFAFCPYSPEAVIRYVSLLLNLQRYDDALLVAKTCLEFDPYNAQVIGLVDQLESWRKHPTQVNPAAQALANLEHASQANPSNLQDSLNLASAYLQLQQTGKATAILDRLIDAPQAQAGTVMAVAQLYARMGDLGKLDQTLEKLVQVSPNSPEAWYNLASLKATLGQTGAALPALRRALTLDRQRRAANPKAGSLVLQARTDPRFASLHSNAEFEKLVAPN